MTELSFLLDILLNHKLQKLTKDMIVERIKEIENRQASHSSFSPSAPMAQPHSPVLPGQQSPSTLALMAKHGISVPQPIVPVEHLAQTPAAAAALQARQDMMNKAKAKPALKA